MARSCKVLRLAGFVTLTAACCGCGSASDSRPAAASIAGDPSSDLDDIERRAEALRHPTVVIATSLGDITVQLDREKAPMTVNNFLFYAAQGRYDSTLFHQVDKGFIAAAGEYGQNMQRIATEFPIRNEADHALKNTRGSIAMGRQADAIDSATSQFFFSLADNPSLDHRDDSAEGYGYCAFGRVIAGLDVLERIADAAVRNVDGIEKMPSEPILIKSVRRL